MITVTMMKSRGLLCGFSCTGHAGYDEAGKDIVCSAVSALTQTCLLGLTEVLELSCGVSLSEEDGIHAILDRDTAGKDAAQADLLMRVMAKGLAAIDEAYPNTLKIRYREV